MDDHMLCERCALGCARWRKDFGDTMTDVVAHYKLDEECGNDDADYRIDEVEGIGTIDIKVVGEQMLYKMDKPLEKICRYARSYPNQKN